MSLPGMFSSLELLEPRIAPAGIITLEKKDFGYVLTGDAAANELSIAQTEDGTEITLTPLDGTQIRHSLSGQPTETGDPVTIRLIGEGLGIYMGDGADKLTLDGLTLPSHLVIQMGLDAAVNANDALTITGNLRVGGNLEVTLGAGTASITGDVSENEGLYVAGNATIFSSGQEFTVDVGSFYVGGNLRVEASLPPDGVNPVKLKAENFLVYEDFELIANVRSTVAPTNAVLVDVAKTFNVWGSLQVVNKGLNKGSVLISSPAIILAEKVIVKNEPVNADAELSLQMNASSVRIDGGLSLTSKSSARSVVSIESDHVFIDGPVTAKLPKSAGVLSIVAHEALRIHGNVNFVSKGEGTLKLQGAGDIFGKVTASLGSGTGNVEVTGAGDRPLHFDGLKVTAPAKVAGSGITITLEDVSLYGKVALLLGRGADNININDSVFRSAVAISTRDGNDTVNIQTAGNSFSEFRNGLGISLGKGDDKLTLGLAGASSVPTALLVYGPKKINGGADTDTYLASGRNVTFYKSFINRLEITPAARAFERFLEN